MRKGKRRLRRGRVLGVILSLCMIAGNISITLTQSRAEEVLGEDSPVTASEEETTTTTAADETTTTTTAADETTTPTETGETTTDGDAAKQETTTTTNATAGAQSDTAGEAVVAGVLDAVVSQKKVDAAFGAGNAVVNESATAVTVTADVELAKSISIATDLTIDLNGHSITALAGNSAFVITQDNLAVTFKSTAAGAVIKGGDGSEGKDGANGGDGSDGIYAGEHKVALTVGANVTVKGGDGGSSTGLNAMGYGYGSGGNGGNGITAVNADSAITIDGTVIGGDGGSGYPGWEKNAGGNGGYGIALAAGTNIYSSSDTTPSVKGGNGGNAGNGGTVGKGGTALSSEDGSANITYEAGKDGHIFVASGNYNYGNDDEDSYTVAIDMDDVVAEVLEKYSSQVNAEGVKSVYVAVDVKKTATEPYKTNAEAELKNIDATAIGAYFDIELSLQIVTDTTDTIAVNETANAVTITLEIPDNMQGGKDYQIIRVHEYTDKNTTEVKSLDTTTSSDGKTVTFETDRFSTFILAYTPAAVVETPTESKGEKPSGSGDNQPSAVNNDDDSDGGSGAGSSGDSGSGNSGSGNSGSGNSGSSGGNVSSSGKSGNSAGTVSSGNGSNAVYLSASNSGSTGTYSGKDSEPTTGDKRQSGALVFVHLGTAAAVLYLTAILVETVTRSKRRAARK